MIGAIVGDIVGSVYEWNNIKTKDFPLFSPECFFTDDTVMTLATAEGLMNGASKEAFIKAMKRYGRLYPMRVMEAVLETGCSPTTQVRITAGETAQP